MAGQEAAYMTTGKQKSNSMITSFSERKYLHLKTIEGKIFQRSTQFFDANLRCKP